jgi:hypothetical protein
MARNSKYVVMNEAHVACGHDPVTGEEIYLVRCGEHKPGHPVWDRLREGEGTGARAQWPPSESTPSAEQRLSATSP